MDAMKVEPSTINRGQIFFAHPGYPDVQIPDVCSKSVVENRCSGNVMLDSPVPGKPWFWYVKQGNGWTSCAVYSVLELDKITVG